MTPAPRGGDRTPLRPHDDALAFELVAAATRALEAGGAAALSLRALTAATGTTTQAVYSLFGGKRGLLDAVLAEGFASLGARLGAVAPDRDPVRALTDLAVAYRAWALEHPALYAAMLAPRGSTAALGGLRGEQDGSRERGDGAPESAVLTAARVAMLGPLRDQARRIAEQDRVHAPQSPEQEGRIGAIVLGVRAAVHGWIDLEQRDGVAVGGGGALRGHGMGTISTASTDRRFAEYAGATIRGITARMS